MNTNDFKKLQLTQMEIMDEVHRVCEENRITYYVIGGTALGARRHGGFIPWDLDIDIAMMRSDYERFIDVCKYKLSPRFLVRDYHNTHSYTHPHALVCIQNTYLEGIFDRYNPKDENYGIYLDVFPLDVAPATQVEQVQHAKDIANVCKLKCLKHGFCYNNKKPKRFAKKMVSKLIFWTNLDKLNDDFDKLCRKYEKEDSSLVCSMSSHYRYTKQCMPAAVYGKPQFVKFEDREYYAPEMLDEYLTRIYGDFMKLPPKEQQKANLDVFVKVVFDK